MSDIDSEQDTGGGAGADTGAGAGADTGAGAGADTGGGAGADTGGGAGADTGGGAGADTGGGAGADAGKASERGAVGGVIYFMVAKVYFMAAGYAVVFGLPRAFRMAFEQPGGLGGAVGLSAEAAQAAAVGMYGDFGVVNSAVSVLNMILIDGIRYTVSKFVSEDDSNAGAVRKAALVLQAAVGGALVLAYLLAARPLAEGFFHRPELTSAFRLSAIIPACYTFYAVFRGYLNGRRLFGREAILDVSFSTLKPVAMLSLAFAGYGVAGAMGGFGAAAFGITLIALFMARGGGDHTHVPVRSLLRFELAIMVYTALFYLLINCDFFLVGNLLEGEAGRQAAGDYYSQLNIARIVWQGTFAITVVIFPMVSKVVAEGDPERTRRYVSQALRFTLIIAGFLAVAFSANAPEILPILFPKGFGADASPLRVMSFGKLAFALFMICTTVISGSGRPWISVILVLVTLVLSGTFNLLAIPSAGLLGAATATLAALAIGVTGGLVTLKKLFNAGVPGGSALRVGAVMAACWLLSYHLDLGGKAADFLECVGLGVVYVGLIFAVR